jgi:hypothetical protein
MIWTSLVLSESPMHASRPLGAKESRFLAAKAVRNDIAWVILGT